MTYEELSDRYLEQLGTYPPQPFGIPDERVAEVLQEYLNRNEVIPADYPWYADLDPRYDDV